MLDSRDVFKIQSPSSGTVKRKGTWNVCAKRRHMHYKQPAHYVETDEDEESAYTLFTVQGRTGDPIMVDVTVNSVPVTMELDTGASVSVLSNSTYLDLHCQGHVGPLQPSSTELKSYTGDAIPVLGSTPLQARYCSGKQVSVVAQVVGGDGPNLLVRDWLVQCFASWLSMCKVEF